MSTPDIERRWHLLAIPESDAKVYIEIGSGASMELTMNDGRRFTAAEIAGYPRVMKHANDCSSFHPGQSCDGGWYCGTFREGDS